MPMASAAAAEVIAPGDQHAWVHLGLYGWDRGQRAGGEPHGRKRSPSDAFSPPAFDAFHKLPPFSGASRANRTGY